MNALLFNDQHTYLALHVLLPIASLYVMSLFADLFSATKEYAQLLNHNCKSSGSKLDAKRYSKHSRMRSR